MTTPNRKGMRLSVYRNVELGDCTNGGISSRYKTVTLVGPGVPEIFEVREDAPAVVIDQRIGYFFLRPEAEVPEGHCGWMAGGNLVGTSDSRFTDLLKRLTGARIGVLPIHDRSETWELHGYRQRLAAAYSTLLEAQPLLTHYAPAGPGFHRPLNEVCEAIRRLRDAGDLDF